jgi:hypothetical protein
MNTNYRLHQQFIFVFVSTCLLFSCKDKPITQPAPACTTCHSISEAKDYFAFKFGSYWIYEEENSHERDSMYISESWINTNYDFYVTIKSQLTDFEYTYWPAYYLHAGQCSETGGVSGRCLYVKMVKGKPYLHLGEANVFFINYKIGDYDYTGSSLNYCSNNRIWIGDVIPKFKLGALNFSDVIRIDTDCEHAEGNQPTVKFYAKGVGIVRKELIDSNQVWNLVNYHIAM